MPALRIEPMAIEDLPAVLAIEAVSFSAPWSEAAYRHELVSNPAGFYIVARLAGEGDTPAEGERPPLIGYAGMWYQYDEAHVVTIAVQPAYRGRGVGARLLLELLVEAMAAGMACVTLEVRVSNLVARRLYERHGFTVTGFRPRYYADNGEDALIMATPSLKDGEWRSWLLGQWRLAQAGESEARGTEDESAGSAG